MKWLERSYISRRQVGVLLEDQKKTLSKKVEEDKKEAGATREKVLERVTGRAITSRVTS